MKYAFVSWRETNGIDSPNDKINLVYAKIRREEPSADCRWVKTINELNEFKPDKIFIPPEDRERVVGFLKDYPCEKDFLENWNVENEN